MSVVTELDLDGPDFPLGRALRRSRETQIKFERSVPLDEGVLPRFWTTGADPGGFEAAARDDGGVERIEHVATQHGRRLYRVEWGDDRFVDILRSTEATVLSASGTAARWQFGLRCADHGELSRLQSRCLDRGIGLEPTLIRSASASTTPTVDRSGLTEKQQEAVTLAVEEGYFTVPRRTTLVELAQKLGVSDQATSERLRRGVENLARHALPVDDRSVAAGSRPPSTD